MNLLLEVPKINSVEELKEYIRPLYIIEDFMKTPDDYEEFQIKLMNIICGCFTIQECREYGIQFKFYKSDNKVHKIQLRRFL